jgi:hypothetical protein
MPSEAHPAGDSGLVRRVKSSMCDTPRLRREVIGKARSITSVIAGFGPEHAGIFSDRQAQKSGSVRWSFHAGDAAERLKKMVQPDDRQVLVAYCGAPLPGRAGEC